MWDGSCLHQAQSPAATSTRYDTPAGKLAGIRVKRADACVRVKPPLHSLRMLCAPSDTSVVLSDTSQRVPMLDDLRVTLQFIWHRHCTSLQT